jgi:hypothetical protein
MANDVFKVVYPTKEDYARVRKINDIKVDDTECTLFFEEWSSHELKSWKMKEVWVRVRGCPKELRDDYLAFFCSRNSHWENKGSGHGFHL